MEEPLCACPDPTLCKRLNKHINGRLWEIWTGVNIDQQTAQKYRNLWERQAKTSVPKAEVQPEGEKKRGCGCGKKK